jgi:hypothetical protein
MVSIVKMLRRKLRRMLRSTNLNQLNIPYARVCSALALPLDRPQGIDQTYPRRAPRREQSAEAADQDCSD